MAQLRILMKPSLRSEIKPDTELGSALLIAQSEEGAYEPVSVVSTINEAIEIAQDNFQRRLKELDRGVAPMCPERYVVWVRNLDGDYEVVREIEPG
jgi:hypothetical protein